MRTPYSQVYGRHPRELGSVGAVGNAYFKLVGPEAEPFTGKRKSMTGARSSLPGPGAQRKAKLRNVMLDGADSGQQSGECYENAVHAVGAGKKQEFKPKRQGTKAITPLELFEQTGGVLTEKKATAIRTLAARANYLAIDRPDAAYCAKAL